MLDETQGNLPILQVYDDGTWGDVRLFVEWGTTEVPVTQWMLTEPTAWWYFDSDLGFCISPDNGVTITTIVDNEGNGYFATLAVNGVAPVLESSVGDPGAPDGTTLSTLTAWAGNLYTSLQAANLFS